MAAQVMDGPPRDSLNKNLEFSLFLQPSNPCLLHSHQLQPSPQGRSMSTHTQTLPDNQQTDQPTIQPTNRHTCPRE